MAHLNQTGTSLEQFEKLFDNVNLTYFIVAPTCQDRIKNQDETDIDCGGTECSECSLNKACLVNSDCFTNDCSTSSKTCTVKSGIPRGGGGGSPFNDLNVIGSYGRTIPTSIIVRSGILIDAIQVTYETSNQTQGSVVTQAPVRGRTSGTQHRFDLLPGETIVTVSGRSAGTVIGLQFTTSTGRVSSYYGDYDGTAFTEQYSGYVLSYISGRCADALDQIQFVWIRG
ncbi:unnamed protein product [Adineta ricciae]|uniref:Jacalin-type lectin domain-containing protein n=1 Tax=Adineta ricciae TaxID=249248 RepID=A0A816BAE8_ADIRI|nr:unnamed protein product [Adineta ricciae]CAF1607528.1 unnamed protein product [Adineta ricciae]